MCTMMKRYLKSAAAPISQVDFKSYASVYKVGIWKRTTLLRETSAHGITVKKSLIPHPESELNFLLLEK